MRPEWADEARALATMVARLTRCAVTPLVVLERAAEWDEARRFHGVDVVPVSGLARYLEASDDVLPPTEVAALREALRMARSRPDAPRRPRPQRTSKPRRSCGSTFSTSTRST